MNSLLNALLDDTLPRIKASDNLETLESIRLDTLGKKGKLTSILKQVVTLPPEEKPLVGEKANQIKGTITSAIESRLIDLQNEALLHHLRSDTTDTSLPSFGYPLGHLHPITQTLLDITAIFKHLGFSIATGPDIESDYFNFETLNIPQNHPARDMHDTFYLSDSLLLRTHTSPVQIRSMRTSQPPLRILAPGKVYRCDADATHSPMFHQIEGLVVEPGATFADLKGLLSHFLHTLFGTHKKVRFRPSYFPFTEPSTEVDVQCVMCDGHGCRVCKHSGWLEILGAGMVQRRVFEQVGYNPDTTQGFAFGLGIDRIAMLRYKIDDIRLLYENDVRFLRQF